MPASSTAATARTRLEEIGDHAVALQFGASGTAIVGVARRLIHQGEDLPRVGIEHHHRTRSGPIAQHCRLETAIGQILQSAVDAQAQIVSRLGHRHGSKILDRVAIQILQHPLGAGFSPKPRLIGKLHALQAHVVDIGVSEQLRTDLAGRVEALVFATQVHPGNVQRHHPMRRCRTQMTAQEHEAAIRIGLHPAT
jgi:hypothetical protein